jgi:hypothetical protein
MQHLLQPRVLNRATVAALVSTVACYPRFLLWQHSPVPIWFAEAAIFFCGIVLWGFVFAWHEPYTRRPVFVFKFEPGPWLAATGAALLISAVDYVWLDPSLRSKVPEDYPRDLSHWAAALVFVLCFNQLFSTFAPFDWLIRLVKNRWVAMALTAILGVGVQAMRIHDLKVPIPPALATLLLLLRLAGGLLVAAFYLRGGVFLVWWWTLIFQVRLLLELD